MIYKISVPRHVIEVYMVEARDEAAALALIVDGVQTNPEVIDIGLNDSMEITVEELQESKS